MTRNVGNQIIEEASHLELHWQVSQALISSRNHLPTGSMQGSAKVPMAAALVRDSKGHRGQT